PLELHRGQAVTNRISRKGARSAKKTAEQGTPCSAVFFALLAPLREICLPPGAEAVAEEAVQVRDVVDLAGGRLEVAIDAAVSDGLPVEQDVAGAAVAVARLADRADVAERLAAVQAIDVIDLVGAGEVVLVQVGGEDPRDVRVALETVARHL